MSNRNSALQNSTARLPRQITLPHWQGDDDDIPEGQHAQEQKRRRKVGWTKAEDLAILEKAALRVSEAMPHSGRDATGKPATCHGAHLHSDVLRALSHHPEILTRAQQLLGGRQYYVHQSRVNHKNTKGAMTDWQ